MLVNSLTTQDTYFYYDDDCLFSSFKADKLHQVFPSLRYQNKVSSKLLGC